MYTGKTKKDSSEEEKKSSSSDASSQNAAAKSTRPDNKLEKSNSEETNDKAWQELSQTDDRNSNEKSGTWKVAPSALADSGGDKDTAKPNNEANTARVADKERDWDTLNQFQGNTQNGNQHWPQDPMGTYAGQPSGASYAQSQQFSEPMRRQGSGNPYNQMNASSNYRGQESYDNSRQNLWSGNQQTQGFQNSGNYPQQNGEWNNYGTQRYQQQSSWVQQGPGYNQNLFAHENNGRNMKGQYSDYENPRISANEYNNSTARHDSQSEQSNRPSSQRWNQSGRRNTDYQGFGSYPERNSVNEYTSYQDRGNNPQNQSQGYNNDRTSGFPDQADYYNAQAPSEFGYAGHDSHPRNYQGQSFKQGSSNIPSNYRNHGNEGSSYQERNSNYYRPVYDDYNYFATEPNYDRNALRENSNENDRPYSSDEEQFGPYQQQRSNAPGNSYRQQSGQGRGRNNRNGSQQYNQQSRRNHDTW